jgi:hypothetical protein
MFIIQNEENLFHDIELEIGSLASRHEENASTQQREHIDYNDDLEKVQQDDVAIHERDMTQKFQQPQKLIPNTMPPPTQHEMAKGFHDMGILPSLKKTKMEVTSTNHAEKTKRPINIDEKAKCGKTKENVLENFHPFYAKRINDIPSCRIKSLVFYDVS